MTSVASRELRNHTRSLLDRVFAGETITITVDGREVAELRPVARRRRWVSRAEFANRMLVRVAVDLPSGFSLQALVQVQALL